MRIPLWQGGATSFTNTKQVAYVESFEINSSGAAQLADPQVGSVTVQQPAFGRQHVVTEGSVPADGLLLLGPLPTTVKGRCAFIYMRAKPVVVTSMPDGDPELEAQ